MIGWLNTLFAGGTGRTVVQVPRALLASCLVSALDFGLMVVLAETFGWKPDHAVVASYVVAGVVQYVLCVRWVFSALPSSHMRSFAAFTALNLVSLAVTWLTVLVVHNHAGVRYTVAKLVAFALAFLWNYSTRKLMLFRRVSR